MLKLRTAILASVAVGVALEMGVMLATGRREAWDSGLYWTAGLPLALLAAAAIGYLSVGTAWRSTILIVPAQMVAMMYRSGEAGGLWPLSLALAFVMSLPFVLVSFFTSKLRRGSRLV